jgi:hypothetical protein
MSFWLRATALAGCTLMAACGPRDARFNPSKFSFAGAGAPPEVVLPKDTKPGSTAQGIITVGPRDEGFCCTATARALLVIRKDRTATVLRIGTYVPVHTHDQVLRVTFPDGSQRITPPIATGWSVTNVPVPARFRPVIGTVRIRVDASRAPYVLTSIYFE